MPFRFVSTQIASQMLVYVNTFLKELTENDNHTPFLRAMKIK